MKITSAPSRSQINIQQKPYQQDFIRLAPQSVREVFACLHGKRDSYHRTKITIKQIEEWTRKSERSVQKATRWLERHGFFHIQEWRESPYYNAPNVYILETEYRSPEWQDFFTCFFKNMCKFAVFTLMSMQALDADNTPLLLKEIYGIDIELVRRVQEPLTFKSFFKESQWGMPHQVPIERESMQAELFTHDQLVELAKYPQDILQRAIDTLAKKPINNPFTWVRKICQDELAKRTDNEAQPAFAQFNKFPSKGKSGEYSGGAKSSTVPLAQVQSMENLKIERYQQAMDRREQKRFDRLVELGYDVYKLNQSQQSDILNRDRIAYYTGEDCAFKVDTDVA